MTHDPLCPVGVKPWEDTYCCQTCNPGETPSWELACRCEEYAKVRADERKKPTTANRSVHVCADSNCWCATSLSRSELS